MKVIHQKKTGTFSMYSKEIIDDVIKIEISKRDELYIAKFYSEYGEIPRMKGFRTMKQLIEWLGRAQKEDYEVLDLEVM